MGREVILRGGAVKQVVGRVVGVEVWGGVEWGALGALSVWVGCTGGVGGGAGTLQAPGRDVNYTLTAASIR